MKHLILILLFMVACEEDNTVRCQVKSGEYETFDRDEIKDCHDKDGDGVLWLDDCDDLDPLFGKEIPNDWIDNDCDGKTDEGVLG